MAQVFVELATSARPIRLTDVRSRVALVASFLFSGIGIVVTVWATATAQSVWATASARSLWAGPRSLSLGEQILRAVSGRSGGYTNLDNYLVLMFIAGAVAFLLALVSATAVRRALWPSVLAGIVAIVVVLIPVVIGVSYVAQHGMTFTAD